MNIFNKITFRNLKLNRTRTAVTIIGVILSVSLFTAVTVFVASLQNYIVTYTIARNGEWHVFIPHITKDSLSGIEHDEESGKVAAVENIGYALLEGSENNYKPYLFISAFSPQAFEMLPVNLISGRLPADDSEVIIPAHIASNGNVFFSVGDTLSVPVGKRMLNADSLWQEDPYDFDEETLSAEEIFQADSTRTYTITGIYERGNFEDFSAPGYTIITVPGTSQSAAAAFTADYSAYVLLSKPARTYQWTQTDAIKNTGYRYNRDLLRFSGYSNDKSFQMSLYSLTGILIILISAGSILLIYNAFTISTADRSRQFGILTSVGATAKQLRSSVLYEGLFVSGIGIPVGLTVGIIGIGVTLFFVGDSFGALIELKIPLRLHPTPAALAAAAAAGLLTILLSAYIPALRVSRMPVLSAIRQTFDVKIPGASRRAEKQSGRISNLELTLALRNFRCSKKRYRTTISSLFVSIVLFISASSFSMFLKEGGNHVIHDAGFDIAIYEEMYADSGDEQELFEALRKAGGITGGTLSLNEVVRAHIPPEEYAEKYLNAAQPDIDKSAYTIFILVDEEAYRSYLDSLGISHEEFDAKSRRFPAVAKIRNINSETGRYAELDMFHKSSLTIDVSQDGGTGVTETLTFDFVAAPPPAAYSNDAFLCIYAPLSARSLFGGELEYRSTMTFMSDDPEQSIKEISDILTEAQVFDGYIIENVKAEYERNRSLLLIIDVFTYGFVVIISLIAVANVFNTITTGIALRKRELAMLRSAGMGEKSFMRMMNIECVIYGSRALAWGLPCAIAISYLIYLAVAHSAGIGFFLPWGSLAVCVAGVFAIVFISMLYSVRTLKKVNIIEVLYNDMT